MYRCLDIDECGVSNGGCAQTCVNTAGSHHCTCAAGYNATADACVQVDVC